MVISFADLAPPYVAVDAALAAGVVVVAYEAPAVVAGVVEEFAVVGHGATVVADADSAEIVLAGAAFDRPVSAPAYVPAQLVLDVSSSVRPAVAVVHVCASVQPVLVGAGVAVVEPALVAVVSPDVEFEQLVLAGGAFDRYAVAPVYVSAQPVPVDGVFDQPVPAVVSATARFAFADGVFDQFASDAQAAADATDRSAFDGLAPGVSGPSVSEGLPGAHLKELVVVPFLVADPATHPALFADPPKLFPELPVFVCLVRWIAGFPGSAVGLASPTCRPVLLPVFFPVPLAVPGADRVYEYPPVLQPVQLWSRSFPS